MMDLSMLENVTNDVLSNVDVTLIVALMAVGFIIKHVKFLEKFENNFIPPFLLLVSLVMTFLQSGFTVVAVISAVVSAAIAIGLHQQGKNIFTISVIPSILKIFNKTEEE